MITPFKTASVEGNIYNNMVTFYARDGQREISVTVEKDDTRIDVNAYVDPEDSRYVLQLVGEYRSRDVLRVTGSHGVTGQLVTDVEAALDLNDDNLVKSRLYFRPSLRSDVKVHSHERYHLVESNRTAYVVCSSDGGIIKVLKPTSSNSTMLLHLCCSEPFAAS